MTVILQEGRQLGRGREHRKSTRRELNAPLSQGSLQRLYPSGVSHLRYQGRDLVQKVAPTSELVRQVRVPDVRGRIDPVAGVWVPVGLDQPGLLPLAQSRWSDPQLPREPSDEDNSALR